MYSIIWFQRCSNEFLKSFSKKKKKYEYKIKLIFAENARRKKDDSETWQTRNFTMAASLMMRRKLLTETVGDVKLEIRNHYQS